MRAREARGFRKAQALIAVAVGATMALLPVAAASAAETIYVDQYAAKGGYYGSSERPSLTGGRMTGGGSTIVTLRTQTTKGSTVLFTTDASNGATANLTHARRANTRERCRWVPILEPSGSGNLYVICKYKY